ncbi:hypothetical protein DYB37_010033 [Aphanomyces astaci]|uniref:Uncharacterized protein n=1 Tax=Aphanomyces astaci TaxID=112090 RepID=A0A3L6USC0_APHAT|nr:hypothetical protein DYB35_004173 [Aphanomyces astaci]RHZ14112.1 hypothetical protein DYB37_010033 [Aphanomyces astaci]RLN99238.1 hypothetical protein DYB28_015585 [Aphanomyces astaci]
MRTKGSGMKKAAAGSKKLIWRGKPVTEHGKPTQFRLSLTISCRHQGVQAHQSADHSSGTHLPHKFLAIESSLLQEISTGSTDPKCNDLKDKRTLLTEEGVEFSDTKVDVSCMYVFTQDDLDQLEAASP